MEIIEKIARILESLDILAFAGIVLTIFFAIRRKSYEIMIKHRLESLDRIREGMSQLIYLFSIEGINDYKSKNGDINVYNADIKSLICSLRTEVKPLYKQEIELCSIIDTVWDNAKIYFLTPTVANEKVVTAENTLLQDKFDLYDWTLWVYIQKLHRFSTNKMRLFDRIYKRVENEKTKNNSI